MNTLDRLTENEVNDLTKMLDQHKERRDILPLILRLCTGGMIAYLILMVFMTDDDTMTEMPLPFIICSVGVFILFALILMEHFIRNRTYRDAIFTNETVAIGIVLAVKCVGTFTMDKPGISVKIQGRMVRHPGIKTQTDTHDILVAVKGLDRPLRTRLKIKVIENGDCLHPTIWSRGDIVAVAYDRTKPRACRIVGTRSAGKFGYVSESGYPSE